MNLKESHIMGFVGVGISLLIMGFILWEIGVSGANEVFPNTSLVGKLIGGVGIVLLNMGFLFLGVIKQNNKPNPT